MASNTLFDRLQEHIKNFETAESDSVSHYCSLEAGLKIIESKVLWMTHHKYLNDPSEIGYGFELISDCIKLKLPEHAFIFNDFQKDCDTKYNAFITSFLMKGDYLPGWRYYGDNGKGIAIRFKKNTFDKKFAVTTGTSPVIYDRNQQARLIDELIEIFLQYGHLEKGGDLFTHFLALVPIFKINDYQDEHEWRVYSSVINEPFPSSLLIDDLEKPTYKVLEFGLGDIIDITFGPACDGTLAKHKIRKILNIKGLPDKKQENFFKESSKKFRNFK